MPGPCTFDYAIIRVVPRVEREEFLNVGVVLHCQTQRFLAARVELDRQRLLAFAPGAASDPSLDLDQLERHLASFPLVCAGGPGSGPIGQLSLPERFHWLTAPRSTVVQVSAVHSGLGDDPARALEQLFSRQVRARS